MIKFDPKKIDTSNNKSNYCWICKHDYCICSNCHFICSLCHNTINSEELCDFIKLLKYSLPKLNIDIKSQVVIVHDYASYHLSAKQSSDWGTKTFVLIFTYILSYISSNWNFIQFIMSSVKKLSKEKQ